MTGDRSISPSLQAIRLHAVIVSWHGMSQHAEAIARELAPACARTTVIHSNRDDRTESGTGQWLQVPQDWYFGRKFRRALNLLAPEETLLLIQADAACADWPALAERCASVFARHQSTGLWAPAIDFTPFPDRLVVVAPFADDGLYEVVQTDAIVLGIHPAIVERLKDFDYSDNNLGWGIDWASLCLARTSGRRILRDRSIHVDHPRGRGYDGDEAESQMQRFLAQLDEPERQAHAALQQVIQKNQNDCLRRYHPFGLGSLGKKGTMDDSTPYPKRVWLDSLRELSPFLHVSKGRVFARFAHPAAAEEARLEWPGGSAEFRPSSAGAAHAGEFAVLDFAFADTENGTVHAAYSDDWSCPGQATAQLTIRQRERESIFEVVVPLSVPETAGDVYLTCGIAAHRAKADLRIRWDADPADDPPEAIFVRFEDGFTGQYELGDYQPVRVRIPGGAKRELRVEICYWGARGEATNPPVMLITRPVLVGAAQVDAALSPFLIVGSGDLPETAFVAEAGAADGDIALVVGTQRLPLVELGPGAVQIEAAAPGSVRVSATVPQSAVVAVNGQPIHRVWLSPEPETLGLPEGVLRDGGTSIELRDPTGTIVYATVTPEWVIDAPRQVEQRHPDAWAIDAMFDTAFYLAGFPSGQTPADPASHYLHEGWHQGHEPTPWFSSRHYLAMNPDVAAAGMNPFVHYARAGHREARRLPVLGRKTTQVYEAHDFAVAPGPHFEEFDPQIGGGRAKRAKVLAYYLPQFHATEINDTNWGRGFTEWRNLLRGVPRFEGHLQPKIPRDLGFYDLSQSDAMRRQIDMARSAGIFGFCFYHYWFDGQRVLDTPVERLLKDSTLDFPFALMWANENWTRTWDGHDREVILQQNYRPEDDAPFIDDLCHHFADPRYIRIDGRPLFFIYRPGQIPSARETIARWRELFMKRHAQAPLIYMAQGFGDLDPRVYGLDGAIEFPPHKLCQDLPNIAPTLKMLDPAYAGRVLSYDTMVERSTVETAPEFPLIRTITPQWDNEARRPGRGMVLHGSTPGKFEAWLSGMVSFARKHPAHGEPLVCINAWNEWAEGAVLEPDVHFGAAYLNAVSRAVHGFRPQRLSERTKVLIVGHDAHKNGAQLLALNIGQMLTRHFGVDVAYVLCNDGPLLPQYKKIGAVHVRAHSDAECQAQLRQLAEQGFRLAITNTTASGAMVPLLKANGYAVVSLIHELPNLLRSYGFEEQATAIAESSDHVLFPAEVVKRGFESIAGPVRNEAEIFPQGLYNTAVLNQAPGDQGLRAELGLPPGTRIVLGAGYADLRKGIDRFVAAALSICGRREDVAFLWVGPPAGETSHWFMPEIEAAGLADRVRVLGHRDDAARFFAASDLYYLSSREDPFPSVVLEALAAGLPLVGHEGTGGCDALIRRHGKLVSAQSPVDAVEAVLELLGQGPSHDGPDAQARRTEILENYRFDSYVFGLLQRLDPALDTVSVVVPNYNYRAYIGDRLQTVFHQSMPLRELLVLDDASTDNSVAAIRQVAEAERRSIDLHVNTTNSGSPFPQWRKGVRMARSDYVWIAEADDLAEPDFVARLIARMKSAGSSIGFCDSRQIDENGESLGDSYRHYVNQIEPGAFDQPFDMAGPEFLARFLAVKNVILNVSGVIFRRDALAAALEAVGDELDTFRVAGDWRLYAEICAAGGVVSYDPAPLNAHRRHRVSVTHALKVEKHLAEIVHMHALIADRVSLHSATRKKQKEHIKNARQHLGLV